MAYLQNNLTTRTTGITVPNLGTVGNDLLRINDVDPTFVMLNDGTAMFHKLLSMWGADAPATQPQYHFFNDDIYAIKTTLNDADGMVAGDTSMVVDDAIGVAGTVIAIPKTGELCLITAVSGSTWTITRGYQGTTAAAIADGDEIVLLGGVLEEYGSAKGGIVQFPTSVDNYVSFFSQSVNASNLQEVTDMLNGVGKTSGEFAKTTLWLTRQIDMMLRYSKGAIDTNFNGTGKTAYFTKGFEQYVTTNVEIPSVGLTWEALNTLFNPTFLPTSSSPTKTLMVSQTLFDIFCKVSQDRWTANPAYETTLGATIGQVALSSGGIIDIVLDRYGFTTQGKQGYLLDIPYIKTKGMEGHEMKWREITLNNEHGRKFEVYGSSSLKVQLPSLHRTVSIV
jgi:hypothetical protein